MPDEPEIVKVEDDTLAAAASKLADDKAQVDSRAETERAEVRDAEEKKAEALEAIEEKKAEALTKAASDLRTDNRDIAKASQRLEFYKLIVLPVVMSAITIFGSTLAIVATAWVADRAQVRRAEEQRQVLDDIGEGVIETRDTVNSASLVALRSNAAMAHRIAADSGDPVDIRIAEAADKLVEEHIEKQKRVDAKKEK